MESWLDQTAKIPLLFKEIISVLSDNYTKPINTDLRFIDCQNSCNVWLKKTKQSFCAAFLCDVISPLTSARNFPLNVVVNCVSWELSSVLYHTNSDPFRAKDLSLRNCIIKWKCQQLLVSEYTYAFHALNSGRGKMKIVICDLCIKYENNVARKLSVEQ